MLEPVRVAPALPLEGPAPTWQEQMYPGMLPESIAEQGELFDVGRPERKARPAPLDNQQGTMF